MDKKDGLTAPACPASTADPVDVGLVVEGNIEIDDMADTLNIEATGGHIGGHEDIDLAILELFNRPQSVALLDIAA